MIELKDGAIFVADAHYQKGIREEFYHFLIDLNSDKLKTKQLILMGDMFDLLVGNVIYTIKQNRSIIELLNHLSNKISIIYLEGNHDFNLKEIFPNINIIPIEQQPIIIKYHTKKLALAHGDKFENATYKFYQKIIRDKIVLKFLNNLDEMLDYKISKEILKSQKDKKLCKKLNNFHLKAKQKLKFYDITHNRFDLICEGHYHIDESFAFEKTEYKIFSSFACDKSYFQLTFTEGVAFNHLKG